MIIVLALTACTADTAAAPTRFKLDEEVKTSGPQDEWDVSAPGGTATWKHCCDGGKWEAKYEFHAPSTLTVGGSEAVQLTVNITSCESGSGCDLGMTVTGPAGVPTDNFIRVHADPNSSNSGSKSIPITLPERTGADTTSITIGLGGGPFVYYTYSRVSPQQSQIDIAAHQQFDRYGDSDLDVSGTYSHTPCKKLPCHYALRPEKATGKIADEDFRAEDGRGLRATFRITSGRFDYEDGRIVVDLLGRVTKSSFDNPHNPNSRPDCGAGSRIGVTATRTTEGGKSKTRVHFGCGAIAHAYRRGSLRVRNQAG